ncbi:unnamed protein product [Cylindrotheca closterium]|uniref:Thioredoxin domain-containing protein n=1 Tax=Cylindrotheca closterium TaxID=2856 RepID=A0AAD2G0C7_9STRA|nr:unnamed protein product [Cylindrotheca closterium]
MALQCVSTMTEMALHESSGPSAMIEAPTNSNSEPTELIQKPMHSVSIPAGADNDVSSSEDNFDTKSSMCASINTAESTLPMYFSDCSFNSSHYDHGSPMSPLATTSKLVKTAPETPKTAQKQKQEELLVSPHSPQRMLLKSTKSPKTPLTPKTPEKPLSKAQSIRERRRMMEAWHTEQKSKSVMSVGSSSAASVSPFSPSSKNKKVTLGTRKSSSLSAGQRKGTKDEMARYQRMVVRIVDAEKQAQNRIRRLSRGREKDARQRTLAMRERAELKLRLSQMEKARDFYKGLMAANTIQAIPMEILKTINDLPKYQPKPKMTLAEELETYVKTMQKEDPEETGFMYQEIRDWKDSADLALDVGTTAPDFRLYESHSGKQVDSFQLRQQWRIILVFYHDYDSPMCKMNLIALEKLKKTFEGEGAKLVAIGFEADTTDTVEETEVTFPLLADEAGILATRFGIIRGEEMPILSTFIIDNDGSILWKYVNTDYTKRPEPMDILEALPEKRSNKRKSIFRKGMSFKKK